MKPFLIAEISSNHNGDLNRAKDMISLAAELGFDAVKFQLFKIDELFSPEILAKSKSHRDRKTWELPIDFLGALKETCCDLGINFGCTPFYLEAVKELNPYVDFFKVSSYEILWHKLFEACCNTGKPIIFSTGMANSKEVNDALNIISKSKNEDVTVLKCTSQYPADITNVNLNSIEHLNELANKAHKNVKIGLSDHSRSIGVVLRAIHKFNVSVVELHIDSDSKGVEFLPGHCWLPDEIRLLKRLLDEGLMADGHFSFGPTAAEEEERLWRADPEDGLRPLTAIRQSY